MNSHSLTPHRAPDLFRRGKTVGQERRGGGWVQACVLMVADMSTTRSAGRCARAVAGVSAPAADLAQPATRLGCAGPASGEALRCTEGLHVCGRLQISAV